MLLQFAIEKKLTDAFAPVVLDVVNESYMHSVPANSETHFKVVLVADSFEGLRLVQRHQQVYKLLNDELSSGVHALALHTYTASEWQQRQAQVFDSPQCASKQLPTH